MVASAGGLTCYWTNDVPPDRADGEPTGFVSAEVSVLPNAEERWTTGTNVHAASGEIVCGGENGCRVDALVSGYWINITAHQATATSSGPPSR